jgi:hypothetical protein
MLAALEKRLARLENRRGQVPGLRPPFHVASRLLFRLVAVHVGSLQASEVVAEGEARALGMEQIEKLLHGADEGHR